MKFKAVIGTADSFMQEYENDKLIVRYDPSVCINAVRFLG
jgi:hypothetical protein